MNILITGCSRGIGRGLLEHYLKSAQVKTIWAVSMSGEKLQDLKKMHAEKLQLTSARVSDAAAKKTIESALNGQTLDLLINCAGTYPEQVGDFTTLDYAGLEEGLRVNVASAIFTAQACLPALQKSARPVMASISSLMGSIDDASTGSYAYRISKASLNMFNKVFSNEYPKITSLVLHPGWVKTDMGGDNAPTTVAESVAGLTRVIAEAKPDQTGHFFDFKGHEIQW